MKNIKLLYIDLFCGAGGTSTGIENARLGGEQCAKVIACVNHDANAIASHAANHPNALHFTEDIRTLDLTSLVLHTMHMRLSHPYAHLVLWASLECTNFSKAKGGMPREADSRTLAEHLFRYIEALRPDYIQIENVEEFMSWGDLDEQGKPISRDKGRLYLQWVNNVKSYGYNFDWRILNAADFGAYTSRKRYFGQFAIKGLPIVFPEQTHAKCTTNNGSLFQDDEIKPWKPVREVLDLNDEGLSIFMRKKPLCERTLERIYAVLMRFPTPGLQYYPVPYYTAIFRGDWFDIKKLIGTGKKAKLRNHASVKYQVEVHRDYWYNICDEENITDPLKQAERIKREKENIKNFVAGIENSGKVWITGYYIDPNGKENRMVRINVIDASKEGGDWSEDIQEAANMTCYGDNIHPNLVGATPGKSQMNNSGSDKRELFTLKQSLEKSWHDIMLKAHWVIIYFNGWQDRAVPDVPLIMLTTLDKKTDAKEVSLNQNNDNNDDA